MDSVDQIWAVRARSIQMMDFDRRWEEEEEKKMIIEFEKNIERKILKLLSFVVVRFLSGRIGCERWNARKLAHEAIIDVGDRAQELVHMDDIYIYMHERRLAFTHTFDARNFNFINFHHHFSSAILIDTFKASPRFTIIIIINDMRSKLRFVFIVLSRPQPQWW